MQTTTRRYNLFQPYYMAFYSRSLYRDVGFNWRGTGYLYLLVLLAICWIPVAALIGEGTWLLVSKGLPIALKDMPEVIVKNGEIHVNRPMPLIISDPSTEKPIIIVDTSGSITSLDDSVAQVLVTKKEIIYKKSTDQIEVYNLPADANWVIDQASIQKWATTAEHWFLWLFYPLMVLCAFIYRVIESLFYALLGMLLMNGKARLPCIDLLRVTVVALTPVIIISTVLVGLFAISFPFDWLCYFLLSMIYLAFGLSSCKSEPIMVINPDETTKGDKA